MVETDQKYYTCKYDKPFKEIMLKESNRDILKELLKSILKVEIKDIEVNSPEAKVRNVKVRRKNFDCLLTTDKGKIEIELNAVNEDYVHPRNMAYICNVYATHTLVGEEYDEDTDIIQINLTYHLNKKGKYDNKNMRIYKMQDDEGIEFVKNLRVVEVNMDFYEKIWYSKNKKKIKENKYLVMLNRNKQELEEMIDDNIEVKKYMEELNKLNKNPKFIEYMSQEEDERKIYNSRMKAAKNEGLSEGLKQGEDRKSIEIARNLLKKSMSTKEISEITGLSEKQVEELKNGN